MNYFAYGSNLSHDRVRSRIGPCDCLGVAALDGWALTFDKHSDDGTHKANMVQRAGSHVLGVVYSIDDAAFAKLAAFEPGYAPEIVRLKQGAAMTEATAFVAHARCEGRCGVAPEYLGIILRGAKDHSLPSTYIDTILLAAAGAEADSPLRTMIHSPTGGAGR